MLELFGKLKVTPIILPGNLEFDGNGMGGGFHDLVQAWISAGSRMIATPLPILPFLLLFSSIPGWKMLCSLMVIVYIPIFHVSCKQYPLMPFVIIISTIFSSLSSPEIPCTLWSIIVHVYGQVSPGLVVVHGTCLGERKLSSGVVNFHGGEWWFLGGRLQSS